MGQGRAGLFQPPDRGSKAVLVHQMGQCNVGADKNGVLLYPSLTQQWSKWAEMKSSQ